MSIASEVRRIFKQQPREHEHQAAELPYDHEPFVYEPATCPFCDGEGCFMCEDKPIVVARMQWPDMTIRRRP